MSTTSMIIEGAAGSAPEKLPLLRDPARHHNVADRAGKSYTRIFPDGSEVCWIAERMIGKNAWECRCKKCGTMVGILSRDLSKPAGRVRMGSSSHAQRRVPPCPKCGPNRRRTEEIERGHPEYISGKNSGHERHTILRYLRAGWLVEVVEGDALAAVERQVTLQKALDNIDNIIKEQKKTQDDTRQTIGEPQNLKLPELANKQTDLAKKTDEVKNTALPNQDKVQKALDQATQAMKEAAKTLGEKKPPEAVAKQDKALDALKQACKDLPCGYFFKALVVGNLGPLKFFQIKALRACAKRALSAKGAAISAALRKPEETTKFGKPVVRLPYLCRKLGVSEGTLRGWIARWNERECRWPILTPENPRPVTYEIDGVTHYLKSQVDDEMAVNLEKLPTMIPKNHPTLYSFDTARNFINDKILVSKECREKHNIIVEPFWVRFKYKLRGETVWYLGEINGFTRKSVDAFRVNQVTCKLPPDTISAAAMACNLRSLSKACRVHPGPSQIGQPVVRRRVAGCEKNGACDKLRHQRIVGYLHRILSSGQVTPKKSRLGFGRNHPRAAKPSPCRAEPRGEAREGTAP